MENIKKLWNKLNTPLGRLLGLCFLLVLVLNILVVPTSDDFGYSLSSGIVDIFQKEALQYMTWNGRSVAHILARSFLALPKPFFDVCNAGCFTFLTYLIYRHVLGPKKQDRPILYSILALLVFLAVPFFGQTVLWETGACNYLWTTTIILGFLWFYRKEWETPSTHGKLFSLGLFFLGILAGWSNENTGGACILLVLFFLIGNKWHKKPFKLWMGTGLLGSLIGFVVMLVAPGNQVRAQDFVNTNGLVYNLVHDLTNALDVLDQGPLILLLILAIGAMVVAYALSKKTDSLVLPSFYLVAGIAAVMAMVISPVQTLFDRSMFGATILILVGVGIALESCFEHPKALVVSKVFLAILVLFSVFTYGHAGLDLIYTRIQYQQREAYVAEQVEKGNTNPVIFKLDREFETAYNPLHGLNDIECYDVFWLNEDYAEVHHLDSVSATPLWKWKMIYEQGDASLMNIQDLGDYINYLSTHPNYRVFITTSTLDEEYATFIRALQPLGIQIQDASYFVAVLEQGQLHTFQEDDQEIEVYGAFDETPYYLGSYGKGINCDIVLKDIDYTNDLEGITFVVFDPESYRVVDSVTWNTGNGIEHGLRYTEDE